MSVWVHFKLICKKYLVCVQYTEIPTGQKLIYFHHIQEKTRNYSEAAARGTTLTTTATTNVE